MSELSVDGLNEAVDAAIAWRRHLHQFPELLFELPETAEFVARLLRGFGSDEVHTGIAKSGVVAVIRGRRGDGPTIGLRCDMDALPINEVSCKPYVSRIPGRMHACGHDGHTAILLGAAKMLAANRDFAGTLVLIFQPAEEGGGGARVMIAEGLLDRFGIEEVYGLHNKPGLAIGSFAIRPGPLLASSDRFIFTIRGKGGHAAFPHLARDPVVVTAGLIAQLQTVSSRYVDPLDSVVLSITYVNGGNAHALNVIPDEVRFGGTIRALRSETREEVIALMRRFAQSVSALGDFNVDVAIEPGYPATVNDEAKTLVAVKAAQRVSQPAAVDTNCAPVMGAEDFSYMLERRPGAIIWLGNGNSASLHNPAYDFNDEAVRFGILYWIRLVRERGRPR